MLYQMCASIQNMTKDELRTIFIPSAFQVVICMLISFLVMIVAYSSTIAELIVEKTLTSPELIGSNISSYLSSLSTVPVAGKAAIILFWSILAVVVYISGLVFANVLIDARNTKVIQTEYTNRSKAVFGLRHFVLQLILGGLLIALVALAGLVLLPLFIQMFGLIFIHAAGVLSFGLGLLAILGTAITVYLLWSLGQVVFIVL